MKTLHLIPIAKPDSNKLEEAYEVAHDVEVSGKSAAIRVPKFFQYDGASVPAPAWQLIGSPFNPRFMTAAVFHDWIYHTHVVPRKEADALFFDLLVANGVGSTRALLMREAVENFGGWYWSNDKDDRAYIKRLKDRIVADGRKPKEYGIP